MTHWKSGRKGEKMTREEAVRILDVYASVNGSGQCTQDEFDKAKRIAIKALEADSDDYARGYKQDMMNNLIKRQDAINAINNHFGFSVEEEYGSAVQEVLNGLPSAQPDKDMIHLQKEQAYMQGWADRERTAQLERKKGRWIRQNPLVDTEECSECGYNIISKELETPFCPWCRADMKGDPDD